MNSYHYEQFETLVNVQKHIAGLNLSERRKLEKLVADYRVFRSDVDAYLSAHFGSVCTHKCFLSKLSACCSREGVITFFADIVINVLSSDKDDVDDLLLILQKPNNGNKCIYLSEKGCRWRIKPIVCQMFLCEHAKEQVFSENPAVKNEWELIEQKRKLFTWPNQPVLFDALEAYFLEVEYQSPLMYLHNSPGLLRVKCKAGL